ncbi:glycoside hydrolase family 61 protein [Ceratobasidium sp. AG-Ba]|nr:glycoside hydrolase family 61 protein [Ceratobasidium sp. AG-Ba]
MLFSSVFSILALAAAGVNAHGYVSQFTANGKVYKGGVPSETFPKSAIRSIKTINPNYSLGGALTCGEGAKAGSVVAPITAGTNLDLEWVAHPGQKWPHNMGPLITYMAKVPAGKTAANVDPATLNFFKIQQTGQKSTGSSKWVLEDLMKVGAKYTVKVPKAIANGDYIMRHEIIALHLANQKNKAEFYTSCFQLTVSGGTGSGAVTPTAKFPGAYSATDAGIWTKNVFNPGFKYSFPGPAIPKFAAGASVAGASIGNASVPDVVVATATATSSAASGTPTGKHCKRHWSSRHVIAAAPAS